MQSTPIWEASQERKDKSHLQAFMKWLRENKELTFNEYDDLWQWSVDEVATFWSYLVEYFDVQMDSIPEEVLIGEEMPDFTWFKGAKLSYAEHVFRNQNTASPAILHRSEQRSLQEISWSELEEKVAAVAHQLKSLGVQKGDCVAAYIANIPEATIAFLATNSIGAIWSSCSPDFGVDSVMDRFQQIEPKVLFAVNGYSYGGKPYSKLKEVEGVVQQIDSIQDVVLIDFLENKQQPNLGSDKALHQFSDWESEKGHQLEFTKVAFNHPIWVLYSSGTTGKPKAITHGTGGMLLEHLKYMAFHNDVHAGERFFWYSTTGWMMWNFTHAALLMGASIVLYDGSAGYPSLEDMWGLAEEAQINHFGTSAPFIVACMKRDVFPSEKYDLSCIRSIGSTGAPLPPEAFAWIYKYIHEDIWLCSMSGGTDVCTAFVGGCILKPVYKGEIQTRALGCALASWNEAGEPLKEEVGEMVITKPMPCMPIFFWGDENKQRYRSSYFEMYPGIWRHGDWVKITDRNTLIILGRSDATLNRQGVRIGTAEIYRCVEQLEEVDKALIVNIELPNGDHFMPLFVKLRNEAALDEQLMQKMKKSLRSEYSPRHVPDEIIQVKDIPETISGKKMETPVKKILMGVPIEKAASRDAMKNPSSLNFFLNYYKNKWKEKS